MSTRFRHHRFIGKFDSQPNNQNPQIELSEQEIFNSPSGNISPTTPPIPKSTSQTGLLAALSETRPGSTTRPVFNHKVSPSSTPPASISIPRRLNQEKAVPFRQSAPISVPIMSKAMRRNGWEFDDVEEEELEQEEDEEEMVLMPPHELVAKRESPMFSNSVLEGVGRTLKGRDLRQVRNAVWRKTGFLD